MNNRGETGYAVPYVHLGHSSDTSDIAEKPRGIDWEWRPVIWDAAVCRSSLTADSEQTRLGRDTAVFHDARSGTIDLDRSGDPRAAPSQGLKLDLRDFDGSFLSLVVDLPNTAIKGLTKRHILQVTADVEMLHPLQVYVRLNIAHGPNIERITRNLPAAQGEATVEFDLAFAALNERRISKAWVDFIFDRPEHLDAVFRPPTFRRYRRARF